MDTCKRTDCECFPYVGVAPHNTKPNSFLSAGIKDPRDWPENFVPELEEGDDLSVMVPNDLIGTYYCPECLSGMEEG